MTNICTLEFAQVNDEYTRWHEAELSWLYIVPQVFSHDCSMQPNLRTVRPAATGGSSTHLRSKQFISTLHCPLPRIDNSHHIVSEPQTRFNLYVLTTRLHLN